MLRKIMIITLLMSLCQVSLAQLDSNVKAKLYYTEAEKLYNQGDFDSSLKYIFKAEESLGRTVARVLALKIKVYYASGEFLLAKQMIDDYAANYMESASEDLNNSVLELYINIEEAAEKQVQINKAENERKQVLREKAQFGYFTDKNLGRVWEDKKTGVVDKSGNIVVPIKYKGIYSSEGNVFIMTRTDGNHDLYHGNKLLLQGYYSISFVDHSNGKLININTTDFDSYGLYSIKKETWVLNLKPRRMSNARLKNNIVEYTEYSNSRTRTGYVDKRINVSQYL